MVTFDSKPEEFHSCLGNLLTQFGFVNILCSTYFSYTSLPLSAIWRKACYTIKGITGRDIIEIVESFPKHSNH